MGAYIALIHTPGVSRLLTAAVLSRISGTMLGVTLALSVLHSGGSIGTAGWTLTGHAVALALLAPVGGRLVDRFGARHAMVGYLAANAAAFGILVAVLAGSESASLIPLAAALVGGTNPPTSAVLRGQWPRIVPKERLHTAYAVDSVSNSAMFVVGPPFAGLVTAMSSPLTAALVAATTKLLGDGLLAWTPGLVDGSAGAVDRSPRILRSRPIRLLLMIAALDTFTYGCLEVLTVSLGRSAAATTGVLLGLVALGEVIGGLTYGSRRWHGSPVLQLAGLHVATFAAILVLGATTLPVVVAVGLVAAGAVGGARDTISQTLLAEAADDRFRTGTFAWLTTVMWGGFAAGTATAGTVHEIGGTVAIAACAALASATAVVVTLRMLRGEQVRPRTRQGATAAAGHSDGDRDPRR
jgi:MFS family permease